MGRESISSIGDLNTQDGVRSFLTEHSIEVSSLEILQGGCTSQVYRVFVDQIPLIVKHSLPRESFYPVYQIMEESRAETEVAVLKKLQPNFPEQIPEVFEFFQGKDIIIMSDVSCQAQLGLQYFLSGKSEVQHAYALGLFLAQLKQVTSKWLPFGTIEQPFEQIWTRGLETEVASSEWGQKMRDYYLKAKPGFVWPDGHPKNIFFGYSQPLVRAIDFDCSHFADQDYMLPNFLGQIPVFIAMGHIGLKEGLEFARHLILGYSKLETITPETEKKMVFYAGTQTIQRQDGKWMFDVCGGSDEKSLKQKSYLFYFGRRVLNFETFDQYLNELQNTLKDS